MYPTLPSALQRRQSAAASGKASNTHETEETSSQVWGLRDDVVAKQSCLSHLRVERLRKSRHDRVDKLPAAEAGVAERWPLVLPFFVGFGKACRNARLPAATRVRQP